MVEFFERELDNMELICNNHLGYEHNKTLRLICNRLYGVQRIDGVAIAIELAALLRRCSYPKRDVIRWAFKRIQGTVLGGTLLS